MTNNPVIILAELVECKRVATRQSVKLIFETDQIHVPESVWLALQRFNLPGDNMRLKLMVMPEDVAEKIVEHKKNRGLSMWKPALLKPPASPGHIKQMAGLHKKGGLFQKKKFWEWLRSRGFATTNAEDAKEDYKEFMGIESLSALGEAEHVAALEMFNKWINEKAAAKK